MRRALLAGVAALLVATPGTAGATPDRGIFVPNDPLVQRQWYLTQDRVFDIWTNPPALSPVRVGVIDSGIDGGHPEFAGKILLAKSFVGGSARTDQQGHGTFVAGEIAAATNNGVGIASVGFPAQLLIAKVVRPDRTISIVAEAAAIRWAVDHGARVINLSLGGLRDPLDPRKDTYSQLEAAAVAYAVRHNVVVVAAVGNGDQAPSQPWPYASYPAALSHVIGVSALARDGSVPTFSNRDRIYNDIAAPGEAILSTLPRQLTAQRPGCGDQGYSDCGPDEYQNAEGTSFAAPQVAGAAALLIATDPLLTSDQVTAILEHSADDVNAATGCKRCPLLRDSLTGWGRLDVFKALNALQGPLPPPDHFEPNDDAGSSAATPGALPLRINATIDFWDDPVDVYRIRLAAGQPLTARLAAAGTGATTDLVLWKPGTQHVSDVRTRLRAAQAVARGSSASIRYRAPVGGWYDVEVKIATPGFGPYSLALSTG